jgi:hypothetical protein
MKKHFLFLLIAIASLGSGAFAQKPAVITNDKPGWHKIAETSVSLRSDRDEVLVMGADHFKSMRLKVVDAPVEFTDITVVFENDMTQNISVRRVIKRGEQTRAIDLDGKDRAIKKIILEYKTVPTGKMDHAHVEIWGLK